MYHWYAHTPNDKSYWHDLDKHLIGVAEKARCFAMKFGASDVAYVLGLLHDVGKVNPEFQEYLQACTRNESRKKVPHSIWGAALFYALKKGIDNWEELALPIMGHHAGLSDTGIAALKLCDFLENNAISLNQMQTAIKNLNMNIPQFRTSQRIGTQRELFIRMLLSVLVDADYLDTEKHFNPEKALLRSKKTNLERIWLLLEANQKKIFDDSSTINCIRKEVYEACIDASSGKPGLYRLTVPTGGGKTRSSLCFALKHALNNRELNGTIVVAIPYTSIIDQTARVYRNILGEDAVLEHHSSVELPTDEKDRQDELFLQWKLSTQNWDAPIIVTTTVQLFESLFSNHPSKVRKLHRLAGAIIILDEVQTLPPHLLLPTLDVIKQLTMTVEQGGYGSTVVFCTATQPAFEDISKFKQLQGISIKEIVPQYSQHFAALRRVRYSYRSEPLSWDVIAQEILKLSQVLVILNTRKDAITLINSLGKAAHVFHLSSMLCGSHRKKVLDEVKRRLKPDNPQPVRLISTQVVEAGVDFDFPVVYRAIGPLDRIVQAAGRCNREWGCESGDVIIFEPVEGNAPRGPYKVGIEKARLLLKKHTAEKLHDPDLYRDYFQRLYADVDIDKKSIQSYREALNFPEVADRYRLIEKDTISVVVPYKKSKNVDYMKCLLEWEASPSSKTWSKLQPFIVNLYKYEAQQKSEWLIQRSRGLYLWCGRYDETIGIVEDYKDPSDLIVSD